MTIENEIGERKIVHQGHSDFSGDFVVEDVSCDGKILRRLIFLNNPNVIQSEVEINLSKSKSTKSLFLYSHFDSLYKTSWELLF